MNTKNEIYDNVLKAKIFLKIIDIIPTDFETKETACGVNRDELESVIYNIDNDQNYEDYDAVLKELIIFNLTLKDYIKLYYKEINNLIFMHYNDINSVSRIYNEFGMKGFLNTKEGLWIFRGENELMIKKNDWVVYNSLLFSSVSTDEKTKYDLFLKDVSVKFKTLLQ